MRDIKDEFVERGINSIDKFLSKGVEKGKLDAKAKDGILGRIQGTTDLSMLKDVDFVIEAVLEDLDLGGCERVTRHFGYGKMGGYGLNINV